MLNSTPMMPFLAMNNATSAHGWVKKVVYATLRDERNIVNTLHDCAFGGGFAREGEPLDVTWQWARKDGVLTTIIRARSAGRRATFILRGPE